MIPYLDKERNYLSNLQLSIGPTESQDVKHFKKNVVILLQNQCLQQSFTESNMQAINITDIYLAKNRHMISGLVDALRSIDSNTYNNNLAINSLPYAGNFLLTLAEIDDRLNQMHNGLQNFETCVSTIL